MGGGADPQVLGNGKSRKELTEAVEQAIKAKFDAEKGMYKLAPTQVAKFLTFMQLYRKPRRHLKNKRNKSTNSSRLCSNSGVILLQEPMSLPVSVCYH